MRVLPPDKRDFTAEIGDVQDLIRGKRLLIVPSGPLTQLPFQVLVTEPPASSDHRATAWLDLDEAWCHRSGRAVENDIDELVGVVGHVPFSSFLKAGTQHPPAGCPSREGPGNTQTRPRALIAQGGYLRSKSLCRSSGRP